MKYTNIFDKMSYLINMIGESSIYPIFLIIITLLTILLISKKIKNNKVIVMMIISYLIMFIIIISNHPRSLSRVFDSISTNLFSNIYFPSTQVYLFTMLIIDIITITSILDKKRNKAYRIANGICFFTTKFLLVLILDVVGKKKIDIFSKKSLFSNTNLVVLLELSIGVFIIWLLSLLVIYITNVITDRMTEKVKESKEIEDEYLASVNSNENYVYENNETLEPEYNINSANDYIYAVDDNANNEEIKDSFVESISDEFVDTKEDFIDKEIELYNDEDTFNLDDLVISIDNNEVEKIDNTPELEPQVDSNILLDRLLNNGLPLIEENKEEINDNKNNYTLNDYKTFNKMLKEVRDMNNSNIINIDSRLDLRLKLRYSEEEYNLFKSMIKSYSN